MGKIAISIVTVICFAAGVLGHLNVCDARATQANDSTGRDINFAGPPQTIYPRVPTGSGFWSFSVVVPGIISRSGQPSMVDFWWLKDHGWKSIINLRTPDEVRWQGSREFKKFNFNYLALPINNNSVPSDKQAQEFMAFVTKSSNQPVHIYCHAGVGRTGVMIALYRYMVQGWPMLIAIIEARFLGSGINKVQADWLKDWAQKHKPGSFSSGLPKVKKL